MSKRQAVISGIVVLVLILAMVIVPQAVERHRRAELRQLQEDMQFLTGISEVLK